MSLFSLFEDEQEPTQPEQAAQGAGRPAAEDEAPAARPLPSGPILAVDVGSVHTRAILLDVVDGRYTFVARGMAPTSTGEPWNDILEGVYQAIGQIAETTGRTMLDENSELIIPEESAYYGIDVFVATASAGQPISAVLVGLMPGVSMESGKRAADSIYLDLIDTFSLADRRTTEERIDALIKSRPDIIMIVGGTDGGAMETVAAHIETIALAYSLMDNRARPPLLYAGNNELADVMVEVGEEVGITVLTAPNVRPGLDMEYLDGAQEQLATLYHRQKSQNTPGFSSVGTWTKDDIYPTAHGFGQFIDLLGGLYGHDVLGIDVGSSATTVSASIGDQHYLNVFGQFGIGHAARNVLDRVRPHNIMRWLTYELASADEVADYLWNRSLYPHTIPVTHAELELEYAAVREIIRSATLSARKSWRNARQRGLLPPFGTILLSGAALANAPNFGWSGLIALDALLPVGFTRVLVDPFALAPALGVLSVRNPQAVVQTLETGAFYDLGTFVSVTGRARSGDVVVRGSYRPGEGAAEESFDVTFGSIETLPLDYGQRVEVTLNPRRVDIEGKSRKRKLTVTGGELGFVIDARGRPWRAPRDLEERQTLLRSWQQTLTEGRGPA